MRQVRFLLLAVFAMLAFGAVSASMASAEESKDGPPRLLILEGSISELEGVALTLETTGNSVLNTAANKAIESTHAHCKITNFNLNGTTTGLDANLADAHCNFEKAKQGATGCRSENTKGEKDPVETILVLFDLNIAAELSTAKVLEPLLRIIVLGQSEGEKELIINCGLLKIKVKGQIGCLLTPGLVELLKGELFELLCKGKEGKQETGTCEVEKATCEELAKNPLLADLSGKEPFESASEAAHFDVEFNKDVLLDD